jgi:hypothetical protein
LFIDHVTVLTVASPGNTIALNCNVTLLKVIEFAPPAPVTAILVTCTGWLRIVIISVPKIPEPSEAVALAVTVPFSSAVKRPVALIVASPEPLTIDHVTYLFVAFMGSIAAFNCNVPLVVIIVVDPPSPVTVMLVTGIIWFEIVIIKKPKTAMPSLAVAMAVIVPFSTAVTRPVELMIACPVLLTIDQFTDLSVAFAGSTDALSCKVPSSAIIVVKPPAPVTVIPVTGIIWLEIVIIRVPKTPEPSLAVALAVIVPLSTAVTSPFVLIVACPVPLTIDHETVLFVALTGNNVELSCNVPSSVVIVVTPPSPEILMLVTGTSWLVRVIIKVPKTAVPSLAVALAVTVPLSTAVTRPVAFIVA